MLINEINSGNGGLEIGSDTSTGLTGGMFTFNRDFGQPFSKAPSALASIPAHFLESANGFDIGARDGNLNADRTKIRSDASIVMYTDEFKSGISPIDFATQQIDKMFDATESWTDGANNETYFDNFLPSVQPDNSSRLDLSFVGVIDTGFQAEDHGTQVVNAIQQVGNQSPDWVADGVGSGTWSESLVRFVDAAKASGHSNAVINLSFDLTQINQDFSISTRFELTTAEREALKYAQVNGVLAVVSAGNQGGVMSALGLASQEFDNVIAVGATEGDQRADYSSYGAGLDFVASGRGQGTSLAAAEVTGSIARIWDANPQLNYRQVTQTLEATATDLQQPGWDAETGFGRLNLSAAIELAQSLSSQPQGAWNFPVLQNLSEKTQADRDILTGLVWEQSNDAISSERSNKLIAGKASSNNASKPNRKVTSPYQGMSADAAERRAQADARREISSPIARSGTSSSRSTPAPAVRQHQFGSADAAERRAQDDARRETSSPIARSGTSSSRIRSGARHETLPWWEAGLSPKTKVEIDIIIGIGQGAWNMGKALYSLATNPVFSTPALVYGLATNPQGTRQSVQNTLNGMQSLAQNPAVQSIVMPYLAPNNFASRPSETAQAFRDLGSAFVQPYVDESRNGHPGRGFGLALFDVATLFIPVGGVAAAGGGTAVKVSTATARVTAKTAEVAAEAGDAAAVAGRISTNAGSVANVTSDAAAITRVEDRSTETAQALNPQNAALSIGGVREAPFRMQGRIVTISPYVTEDAVNNGRYFTYTLRNADGEVRYVGRTSSEKLQGIQSVVNQRMSGHHILKAHSDKIAEIRIEGFQGNAAANRGAEDVLYSYYQIRHPKGTMAPGANSGGQELLNSTNPVSSKPERIRNPNTPNGPSTSRPDGKMSGFDFFIAFAEDLY